MHVDGDTLGNSEEPEVGNELDIYDSEFPGIILKDLYGSKHVGDEG